jgi:hypothetical protein
VGLKVCTTIPTCEWVFKLHKTSFYCFCFILGIQKHSGLFSELLCFPSGDLSFVSLASPSNITTVQNCVLISTTVCSFSIL